MSEMQPKKPGSGHPPAWIPNNIVTEIVDQITRKQDRAVAEPRTVTPVDETCSACLEESIQTTTPYRFVLRCASDDFALTRDFTRREGGDHDA